MLPPINQNLIPDYREQMQKAKMLQLEHDIAVLREDFNLEKHTKNWNNKQKVSCDIARLIIGSDMSYLTKTNLERMFEITDEIVGCIPNKLKWTEDYRFEGDVLIYNTDEQHYKVDLKFLDQLIKGKNI